MKSVIIAPRSKFHAQTIADLFNVPVSEEMAIPMEAIDRAVEDYLDSRELSPSDSGTAEYAPERCDRTIVLTPAEDIQRLQIDATFLARLNAATQEASKTRAYRKMQLAREALRTAAVLRNIPLDMQGLTLIYGLAHEKAVTISCDGIQRHCHTLIHGSHALNPEDEYLRELQVTCDRIVRYHVPGLDDGRWQLLNQPLRWPMTTQECRQLLLTRIQQTAT